jgi:hypothetical protein
VVVPTGAAFAFGIATATHGKEKQRYNRHDYRQPHPLAHIDPQASGLSRFAIQLLAMSSPLGRRDQSGSASRFPPTPDDVGDRPMADLGITTV